MPERLSARSWFKKRKWKKLLEGILETSPDVKGIALGDKKGIFLEVKKNKALSDSLSAIVYPLSLENQEVIKVYLWTEDRETSEKYFKNLVSFLQLWLETEYSRRAVTEEALDRYREISFFNHIAFALNSSLDLREVTSTLIEECRKAVPIAKYGAVCLYDKTKKIFKPIAYFGEDIESITEKVTETYLFKEIVKNAKPEIVNQVGGDLRWNAFVPQIISFLGVPLSFSGEALGGLFLAGTSPFTSLHLKSISTIAAFGAIAIANAVHFLEIQKMLEAVMVSLATAIDSRDPCTAGHSRRTAQYAWALANAVNEDKEFFPNFSFTKEQMREIYYAALLHDVGKIGVREHVLNKATKLPSSRMKIIYLRLKLLEKAGALPSRFKKAEEIYEKLKKINTSGFLSPEDKEFIEELSKISFEIGEEEFSLLDEEEKEALLIPRGNLLPNEWEEIKKHPVESDRILEQIPFPESMLNLRTIVRQHHEKLDGSGYPDGKEAEEILFQSRILTICDIYDALTAADRPYKKAFSMEKAIEILRKEAKAGKLDSRLVEIFIQKVLMQK